MAVMTDYHNCQSLSKIFRFFMLYWRYMKESIRQNYPETGTNKNESIKHELSVALQNISHRINELLGTKLLSDDGTVSMKAHGYSKEELSLDKEWMRDKENQWIVTKYGLNNSSEISSEMRSEWEAKQRDRKSELVEMITMLVLCKGLGDDYVVARASKFDDYHGVDNLIVNKHTGAIICAFDDVHSREGGEDLEEKKYWAEETARRGGTTIKYGFTFADDQLVKQELKNVPKFYMHFDINRLDKAMDVIDCSNLEEMTAGESELFYFIIDQLGSQVDNLRQNATNQNYLHNLETFNELLPKFKKAS